MNETSDYARRAGDAFARLISTVEQLRDPGGCPWDADQTHESLRQYLLEETYELLDAVDSGDSSELEEELGDLLIQVAFHADIAMRDGRFDTESVANKVREKLVARHPHVFGDGEQLTEADQVVDRWDQLKREESGRSSAVASLPVSLPALALSGSVQSRAIKAGLKWPENDDAPPLFERVDSESDGETEKRAAALLMQVALEAKQAGIDPEIALRTAAVALRSRVLRAEELAGNIPLAELSEADRDRAWQESSARA